MRKLNADPEFAKAHAERMRKLHADPEFAKAHAERMRKLHADPEFNPLAGMTQQQKKIYRKLCAAGIDRQTAIAEARK